MRAMIFFSFATIALSGCLSESTPLTIKPGQAEYDQKCDFLAAEPPFQKIRQTRPTHYFDQPVPKLIHQIWMGPKKQKDQPKIAKWQNYATKFGYKYRMWSEADLPELQKILADVNYDNVLKFVEGKNYWGASDIIRLELLKNLGGIYSDVDISPSSDSDELIDLADIVPLRGLTLITETNGRTIGNSSLFVCNNFIAAAPNHPLITHLADNLANNISKWRALCVENNKTCDDSPAYQTGPFYISRALSGAMTVLPISYTHALGMTDEDK